MNDALGQELLRQARAAIEEALGGPPCPPIPASLPELNELGATFVTLMKKGLLRGCIGSLESWRPLIVDVRANAVASALRDPRFYPLEPTELPATLIEVSLLSKPEPIDFENEAELLRKIIPREDGIIITRGVNRATFLPQVWEQLPDTRLFLAHLKQKSGLSVDTPIELFTVQRYRVRKWKEEK